VPVLGMVENISYFMCPHCGGRSEIFSHGGARLEAERFGTEFLGAVLVDPTSAKPPTAAPRSTSPSPTIRTRWFSAIWRPHLGQVAGESADRRPRRGSSSNR
jgi:ATP-binding protein involved in chromosome partitioning